MISLLSRKMSLKIYYLNLKATALFLTGSTRIRLILVSLKYT